MKNFFLKVIILNLFFLVGCQKTDVNNIDEIITPLPTDFYWVPLGLDSNSVISFYQSGNGYLLAGTNYGLFISADSGLTWLRNNHFDFGNINCFTSYNDKILAGTSNQGVLISSDNGINWSPFGLQNVNVTAIEINNSGRIFAATRSNGIYMCDSIEWKAAGNSINTKSFFSLLITSNGKIYAGGTGVYRSDDSGNSWHLKNVGLGNWAVLGLITDKLGRLAAGTDNGGIFISINGGENWLQSNNGLSNKEITSLSINSQRQIFAGTWGKGIFYSSNFGNNWTSIDSGLSNKEIQCIYINNEDIIYAGTFKGVYRSNM